MIAVKRSESVVALALSFLCACGMPPQETPEENLPRQEDLSEADVEDAADLIDPSSAEAPGTSDQDELQSLGVILSPRPACASVRHTVGTVTQTVTVCNRSCASTISFVVRRVGLDSPCLHAAPRACRSYRWANGFNYQGTDFGCD
jgi:hypothetical protein